MSSVPVAASTYEKELYNLGYGLPRWYPEDCVNVGDVGFLPNGLGGRFIKLFNIYASEEQQSDVTLPTDFKPLSPPSMLQRRVRERELPAQTLVSQSIKKKDIDLGASAAFGPAAVGAGVRYQCSSGSGGILILGDDMRREDINQSSRDLREYIKRHAESWSTLAESLDCGFTQGQELPAVTGYDSTSEWAIAAFTEKNKGCAIEVYAGAGGPGADISLSSSWAKVHSLVHRYGPWQPSHKRPSPMISQSSQSHSEPIHKRSNQTVFLRGLYIRVRPWAPLKMRAAAEPTFHISDRDDDDSSSTASSNPSQETARSPDRDDKSSISSFPSEDFSDDETEEQNVRHPVGHLLDFILQASDCRIALAHDSDVYSLCKLGKAVLHNFPTWLAQLNPHIHMDSNGAACLQQPVSPLMRDIITSIKALSVERREKPSHILDQILRGDSALDIPSDGDGMQLSSPMQETTSLDQIELQHQQSVLDNLPSGVPPAAQAPNSRSLVGSPRLELPPSLPTRSSLSSEPAISLALEHAHKAAQLDKDGESPREAVAAYAQSTALLKRIIHRMEYQDQFPESNVVKRRKSVIAKEEERQRIQLIHDTYADRIKVLSLLHNIPELSPEASPALTPMREDTAMPSRSVFPALSPTHSASQFYSPASASSDVNPIPSLL